MSTWEGDRPLVSVGCSSYQQVEFVRDALMGILGQVTTFPFEVLVRDDASSDGTVDVLREFERLYPNIIRLTLEPCNTFGQKSYLDEAIRGSAGQFVAICEADDYWVTPEKLQRQVESLTSCPAAATAFHDYLICGNGLVIRPLELSRLPDHVQSSSLRRGKLLHAHTLLFRNLDLPPAHVRSIMYGSDHHILARLGIFGSAIRVPDLVGVYRKHEQGIFTGATERRIRAEGARTMAVIAYTLDERGFKKERDHWIEILVSSFTGPGTPMGFWARIRIGIRMFREAFRHLFRRSPPAF